MINSSNVSVSISIEYLKVLAKPKTDKVYTYCPHCNAITTRANPYCNVKCKIAHNNLLKIMVSYKFVKMLFKLDIVERDSEIKNFAIRHDYDLLALYRKIHQVKNQIDKEDIYQKNAMYSEMSLQQSTDKKIETQKEVVGEKYVEFKEYQELTNKQMDYKKSIYITSFKEIRTKLDIE